MTVKCDSISFIKVFQDDITDEVMSRDQREQLEHVHSEMSDKEDEDIKNEGDAKDPRENDSTSK